MLIYENPDKRHEDDADFVLCLARPLRKTTTCLCPDNDLKKDIDQ